ncbi:hypothetical protein RB614_09055 [Phytohabitans sp. ZYX-F-186]|uniref:Uncharacterized protein n=1 Tax=Phytohabitans maris TaxID=3071409 RepID=A0ABU0ZE89_9ACTN|nr:hypothetical protein [Phytohabitans sp. ZYX-F-186]MDQ7904667.1 hypothetical protein [Phytohabitans sp. ZYX-F-186]
MVFKAARRKATTEIRHANSRRDVSDQLAGETTRDDFPDLLSRPVPTGPARSPPLRPGHIEHRPHDRPRCPRFGGHRPLTGTLGVPAGDIGDLVRRQPTRQPRLPRAGRMHTELIELMLQGRRRGPGLGGELAYRSAGPAASNKIGQQLIGPLTAVPATARARLGQWSAVCITR